MALVSDFLHELTNAELVEVALTVGVEKLAYSRKEELVDRILASRSAADVAEIAERVETLRGFKHVWLFSIASGDIKDIEAVAAGLWPNAPGTHVTLDDSKDELQPTLQFIDAFTDTIYVKLTHWVQSDFWELVAPGRKELKSARVRHPVTVVLHVKTRIVEFRFGGYTQGSGTPKASRLPYEELVERAARVISLRLGADVDGLRIGDAVSDMLEVRHEEVIDVRRVVKPLFGGRLVLDAADVGTDMDVSMLLSKFFAGAVSRDTQQIASQIREVLDRTPVDSMLLAWSKPGILTRLAHYEIGPELLFIWRGEERTLETIEYVVSTIAGHMRIRHSGPKEALQEVLAAAAGDVFRAADLANRYALSAHDAYAVLEEARRRGLVERRYKVRTEKATEQIPNHWRSSLSEMPEAVTTEDGEAIDLQDPRNIEVGFQRVGGHHVD